MLKARKLRLGRNEVAQAANLLDQLGHRCASQQPVSRPSAASNSIAEPIQVPLENAASLSKAASIINPTAKPSATRPDQGIGIIRLDDPSIKPPHFLGAARLPIDVMDAIHEIKAGKRRKFDESIDVCFQLGIDPRRGDQGVRGAVVLPHGTGKPVKVCVFAEGNDADIATAAGADMIGNQAVFTRLAEGHIDFDKCIATKGMMSRLREVARVLGPKGLMPSPKLGTLVDGPAITTAVKEMKGGRVEYRADKMANLIAGIGRRSFLVEHIYQNLGVFAGTILDARPVKLKGSGAKEYILKVHLSSTMGRGIPLSIPSVLLAASQTKLALR